MSDIKCCCEHCFKRLTCVGCNWFSDMCKKDKSTCSLLKVQTESNGVGDTDVKCESE